MHLQEVRRFECFNIGSITTALKLRYDTARHIRVDVINFLWLILRFCQYIKVFSVAGRMPGEGRTGKSFGRKWLWPNLGIPCDFHEGAGKNHGNPQLR